MRLRISVSLLLMFAPALAFASAHPKAPSAHMRPQLFRDRTPKARVHMQIVRR